MIKVNNITKTYGDLTAVDNISFEVPQGEICGYLGPNGAGKTTTVKILTGMTLADSGHASIGEYDIAENSIAAKKQIGYVPESGALYESLTPYEYLTFVGELYHMAPNKIDTKIEDLTEFMGLEDVLHKQMTDFSKGMKQKVLIISAVIHNPEVIFLDEPLNGLDANAALLLKKLLHNLTQTGKTILYCSHVMEVVENLCSRIVIINEGQIIADDLVKNIKANNQEASLEDVFNKLTDTEDKNKKAEAFSKVITE